MDSEKIEDITDLERIALYLTNLCNLGCRFCWRTSNPYDRQDPSDKGLSKKKYKSIVEDALNLGCKEFTISGGGEPLMRKEVILEIARIIHEEEKARGDEIRTELVTNGTLLDREAIKKLYNLNWSSITFSIHSSNARTNDYLTGRKGAFKKALQNIKKIRKIKDNRNQSPSLASNFVINRFNYREPAKMVEFGKMIGLESIHFRLPIVHKGTASKLTLNKKEELVLKRNLSEAREIANRAPNMEIEIDFDVETLGEKKEDKPEDEELLKIEGNMDKEGNKKTGEDKDEDHWGSNRFFHPRDESEICPLPFREIIILPNGDAYPCCSYPKLEEDIVDNVKNKSLEKVWSGERMKRFRYKMAKGTTIQGCIKCDPNMSSSKEKLSKEIQSSLSKT